jgi:hypothetical protein
VSVDLILFDEVTQVPVRVDAREAGKGVWRRDEAGQRSTAQTKCVLQSCHMSQTLTIRLTDELLAWLKETSRQTGVPMGRLVREQIEHARAKGGKQRFMRHVGAFSGGPADLSSRKGFSRS